jgi:uncharacterized protein DUF4383
MDNARLAQTWMLMVGIALVGAGIIGFISNPIASADPSALFQVNAVHNVVRLATGALALWIALATRGGMLALATLAFGLLYAALGIVLVVDPTLFGLLSSAPANRLDHVLHAAVAIVSIGLGLMARDRTPSLAA